MSDYTKTTNFTAKDNLTTGNALKVIKGAYFDTEFDAIVTAIATKYDSGDIASQAQAEALSSNTVLMTPGRVNDILADNASMLQDIQALVDPNADTLLGWDDSAGAAIGFTAGAGIVFSTTTVTVDHDAATNFVANEHIDHSAVSVIAGTGLTGGGTIAADRTINVIGGAGITANANEIIVDLANNFVFTGDNSFAGTSIYTGNATFNEAVVISEEFTLSGVIGLVLSGTEDNFAVSTNAILRITGGTSTPKLGGMAGGADGRIVYIFNASSNTIVVEDQDSGSDAANRFDTTGSGRSVVANTGIMSWYDGVSSRWRLMDE